MNDFPALSIVGPGRVGTAIGILAARAGYPVVAVGGRHRERTIQAARRISESARACGITEAAKCANLVFLTVTDDTIEQICSELADQNAFNSNSIVAHCSGALSSDILSSARDSCRCLVASMHPLQTFAMADSACAKLEGTYCFCEGDKEGLPVIESLAKRIGMIPVRICSSSKVLYHAAAVFACNYLVTLMDAAIGTANLAKIDRSTAWSAFAPLVVSTIENISAIGPDRALTGPIERGDIRTIARHIEKLELVEPSLASMYRAMARHAVDIALRKRSITEEKGKEIRRILKCYAE
ncbi:Rossmann-like and DUF2520 domain-containing protein [Planctomycetota bacterium]